MIIYCDESQALHADYYDSEGHVIRYSGQMIEPNKVILTSEPAASSPGFRLTYQLGSNDILKGDFEIANPNQPGTFVPYLSWSARREVLS